MLKILFAILLGVMLAFFIGLGIEAFYPTEKFPETPAELQFGQETKAINGGLSAEQIKIQKDFDQMVKDYQKRNETHARNVSMMAIAASIIFMALALIVLQNFSDVFSNGFLIGSILTLLYGIIRGFESSDNKFRFLIVTVGLIFALILGYIKFIKQKEV